jgi:uncharacterized membrane protein
MLPVEAVGEHLETDRFAPQLRGDYTIDASACIRDGWNLFRQAPGKYIGYTLLIMAGLLPLELPSQIVSLSDPREYTVSMLLIYQLLSIIASIVSIPLYAGYYFVAVRQLSGQEFSFRDFFGGFRHPLQLVLAAFVSGIFFFFGMLLLVLPGIYLVVSYSFMQFLIIDHHMNFWQAMQMSRKVVTRHWLKVFWLLCLLFLVNVAGILALGIGILVAVPVSYCALTVAYRQVFGFSRTDW